MSEQSGPAARPRVTVEHEMARLMAAWETLGFIGPNYAVDWSASEGCWRAEFTVADARGRQHRYGKNQAELCQYAMGIADALPDAVGQAARALADLCRDPGEGS